MDLPTMVAAFEEAPYIEVGPAAPHSLNRHCQHHHNHCSYHLRLHHSSKASRISGDSSISNSGSGSGSVALAKMRYQFDSDFAAYQGLPWSLPSGSIVDEVVARLARQGEFESGCPSFIHKDPCKIIAVFPVQDDKDKLHKVLDERPQEALATLTEHEQALVGMFSKSPQEVKMMLGQSARAPSTPMVQRER
ncbi:MAG: hypothetical protein J3Q66DRAFT_5951 [Benniella sp.]|nr:MAG: hypothetical protein J3Q66DRAFT_5951 [Benniella sp.]